MKTAKKPKTVRHYRDEIEDFADKGWVKNIQPKVPGHPVNRRRHSKTRKSKENDV